MRVFTIAGIFVETLVGEHRVGEYALKIQLLQLRLVALARMLQHKTHIVETIGSRQPEICGISGPLRQDLRGKPIAIEIGGCCSGYSGGRVAHATISGRNCRRNSAFHGNRVMTRSQPTSAAIRQRSPMSDSIKSEPRMLSKTESSSRCCSRQVCRLMVDGQRHTILLHTQCTSDFLSRNRRRSAQGWGHGGSCCSLRQGSKWALWGSHSKYEGVLQSLQKPPHFHLTTAV